MKMVDSDVADKGKIFPPGFRFHPTDEELVLYYLKRKVCRKRHLLDVIGETDVYKWDPEELPGMSKLKTEDRQWFFFSPRDRKYPNGARANRATRHGYWKATGKDRTIPCGPRTVGTKKTLVFYRGRAPSGERTDWVMHEYTIDEEELKRYQTDKDYYVLYKVYKKSGPGPKNGEQYGAPFREEYWDNDELEVHSFTVDNVTANDRSSSSPNILTEIMKNLEDEPINNLSQLDVCTPSHLPIEGVESKLDEHAVHPVSVAAVPNYNLEVDVPDSYDCGQTDTNQLLDGQRATVTEDDFLEDFLTIDDLQLPPVSTTQNTFTPNEELHFDQVDGFNELDFQDALLFFPDFGNFESYQIHGNDLVDRDGTINGIFPSAGLDNLTTTIPLHQQFSGVNGDICRPYMDEQSRYMCFTETGQDFMPYSNPGVIHENQYLDSVNHPPTGVNEIGSKKQDEDDGTDSWLSSALWSFVESIPTTPASASESVLVNRALRRMSSLSRLRLNTKNVYVPLPSSGSSSKSMSSLVLVVSFVGVICAAALWMSAIL